MKFSIRRQRASDLHAIEAIDCANHGQKWQKAAQRIIRKEFPELAVPGSGVTFFVAEIDSTVVGVIGFGVEGEVMWVYSMGVRRDLQGSGIGTALKRAAMADCAASYGRIELVSIVHRKNFAMLRVNEKLGVTWVKDPSDGDYVLTGVIVEEDPDGVPPPLADVVAGRSNAPS